MPMADVLTLVAVGLAISTVFHLLVLPLLPSRVREGASWWRMRLRMYLRSSPVGMELVSKATAPGGPPEPAGEVWDRTAASMRAAGLDVTGNDTSLEARVKVGRQSLSLSVRLAAGDDGAFEQAEIVVGAECGYRDFEGCIAEMREAQAKAREALSGAGLVHDKTFCIVCKLESLPQAKVMLDSVDADMMSYTTPDGHAFDLYGNKIEYCDTEVHRGMTSFLKKVLVAHS